MHKLTIICLMLLGCSLGLQAQQLTMSSGADTPRRFDIIGNMKLSKALQLAGQDEASQARVHKMYSRWLGFWQDRYTYNVPTGSSIFDPLPMGLRGFYEPSNYIQCLGNGGGNWNFLGPVNNYFGKPRDSAGRVTAIWINPDDSLEILAGSASGGLFRTLDGGENWTNITDNGTQTVPSTMGIGHIAVHPADPSIICLGTGTYASYPLLNTPYNTGIVYTINNGLTWTNDAYFRAKLLQTFSVGHINDRIYKIAFSPYSQKLYAVYKNRIYMRWDFSNTGTANPWQDITPSFMSTISPFYQFMDFEFEENPQGKIVFATNCVQNTQYLLRYDENSLQWGTPKAITIPGFDNINPAPTNNPPPYWYAPFWGIQDIALNPSNEVYMKVVLRDANNTATKTMLYRYNWSINQLTLVNADVNAAGVTANHLVISKHNPQRIYITDVGGSSSGIFKSENGGATFTEMQESHPDGRMLVLYRSTNSNNGVDDVLYCGTDGGVSQKPAGSTNFFSITGNGLHISEMYSLSTSASHSGLLTAGAVDNGTQAYIKHDAVDPWKFPRWGDGLMTAFARNGVLTSFSQWQGYKNGTGGMNSPITFNLSNGNMGSQGMNNPQEHHQDKWWKPLKFDHNNTARVGYWFIWKKSLDPNAAWQPAFGSMASPNEPKSSVLINDNTSDNMIAKRGHKLVRDFIVSEYDGNIGYIAYGTVNWSEDPDGRFDDLHGKLFVSKNLFAPTPTWTNVSPPHLRDYQITDIEIDYKQPNRIFVAYGGTQWDKIGTNPATRTARVMYNYNWGAGGDAAWQDVSKGLPPVTINKILFVEGSDDIMFAATDVGVYRWNKAAQQWECFNNGLPRCMVTDMDLNYCSGKLRVTTMGRGIWETDYTDMNALMPGYVSVITSNTTWNSSRTISGSLKVAAGATLTISGSGTKIYMPRRGRITIEPQGKLIVDGAMITNECGNTWYGIEVAGNNSLPATPANQGYLELRNDARLEHARVAISNFDLPAYRCGGIIRASNSHIDNCIKAVALNNTPLHSYTVSGVSNCNFENVTFNKNDLAYDIDQMGYFASWNVKGGVVLKNCTFHYSIPWDQLAYNKRYTAINLSATGLRMQGCYVDGYQKGIYANGYTGTPSRTVNIYNNTFNHNSESIMMAGDCYGDIKGNTVINMYPYQSTATFQVKYPVGIYLDYTRGATVGCGNYVNGSTDGGPWPTINRNGFATYNSGYFHTTAMDNTFTNLGRGAQPQMDNPKLNIMCNLFEGNRYAMAINPETGYAPNTLMHQGTGCAPTDIRAGNRFISNQTDIASFLANSWTYNAGNGPNQVPNVWWGNMSLAQCNTNVNSQCNLIKNCAYQFDWNGTIHTDKLFEYNTMVAAGQKESLDAQVLFADIVRGYNTLDDIGGLQTFLETENDDRARKLLIPLYIELSKYTQALNTISALSVSPAEQQAYASYYNVLINLHRDNLRPDALDPDQLAVVQDIAAQQLEVSGLARGLMEAWFGQPWDHIIEEIPGDDQPRTHRPEQQTTSGAEKSRLFDAAPNPSHSTTMIKAFVTEKDAAEKMMLVLRNPSGTEIYRKELHAGHNEVEVSTREWTPGLYFYTMGNSHGVLETKKLIVAH